MGGIGDRLSPALALPPLEAVLVNPGAALATKDVFAGWAPAAAPEPALDLASLAKLDRERLLAFLAAQSNDLEAAAIEIAPAVAAALAALRGLSGCRLARMSGSGSTCFGIFSSAGEAAAAAKILHGKYPQWWSCATRLGSAAAQ
jgi:4-diphosphocytidyl-2-C-methyl-D-erythritol kinase